MGNNGEALDPVRRSVLAMMRALGLATGDSAARNISDTEGKRLTIAKEWRRANHLQSRIPGDPGFFANPPLNILLELYIAYREDQAINVAAVCAASGVPIPTALRYMTRLAEMAFIWDVDIQADHRFSYTGLTANGLKHISKALDAVSSSRPWEE